MGASRGATISVALEASRTRACPRGRYGGADERHAGRANRWRVERVLRPSAS